MVSMAGKRLELAACSEAVAENVRRLLGVSDLNHTSLSAELAAWADIPPLAIGRIVKEGTSGRRRRSDGFGCGAGVSPSTLLMPSSVDAHREGHGKRNRVGGRVLWEWLIQSGRTPG